MKRGGHPMRIAMFYHSILSDWNHGNAHFLRGVVTELMSRGHHVHVYEPKNGWSYTNLMAERGPDALKEFRKVYPGLTVTRYEPEKLHPDAVTKGCDLVLVHEWNEPDLVARLGNHRKSGGEYLLLFHDTHHRSVTDAEAMERFDLTGYDGVLAYGARIRDLYLAHGWARRVWVWHEAADIRVFHPLAAEEKEADVVWVGNWGDEERSEEIMEFFVDPVARLRLKGSVYGVRYPEKALKALKKAGIRYGGWLPNYEVPRVFNRHRMTVHIPRRPYVTALPGIPTIRPFEALACGIPLLSAPWDDCEHLFAAGEDLLYALDGKQMEELMRYLLDQPQKAKRMARHGLQTILSRHTCGHRVDELIRICRELQEVGEGSQEERSLIPQPPPTAGGVLPDKPAGESAVSGRLLRERLHLS